MLRRLPVLFVVASIALFSGSCGDQDDGPGPGDTTPPTITSTVPADGETDVGLVQRVEITFSEPMNVGSISGAAIVIEEQTVRGYFDYDPAARTAYVIPETLYAPETPYRIIIEEGFEDPAGNALAAPDTFDFETGPLDCEHLVDYLEPNDGVLEASPIDFDETYPTLTLCDDDQDLFEFEIDQPVKIGVNWYYSNADSLATYFDITRTDGNTYGVFTHTAMSDDWRVFYFTLLPGTYYLGMWAPDVESYVLYDLNLTTGEPCPEDPYEDNDFRVEAHPISPGLLEGLRGCIYDNDYFELDLAAGADVTITVTNTSPGSPNRLVALYPEEGVSVVSDVSTENPLTIQGTTTEAGTHYVQITFYANDVVYDLNVGVAK
jgi:hypothetical protein